MKNLIFSLIFVFSVTTLASEFDGTWEGSGYINLPHRKDVVNTTFKIDIMLTDSEVKILDCYEASELSISQCHETIYNIQDKSNIFDDRGKKVGDIYPRRLVIYNGNTQVSEQFLIALNNQGLMSYRYTNSNMDGEFELRQAILSRK